MKRSKFGKILIITAVAASMAVGMLACGAKSADGVDPAYVEQLEKECVDLRSQLQGLENQLGDLEQSVVLKSYTLKANPNDDGTGATVEITATPMRYEEGQLATFRISLNGAEVQSVSGTWDGSAYTGSVELPAEDGYTYECVLNQMDGSENNIVLSSPEAPLYESCVYLASGLNVYCNMFIEDWAQEGTQLTLTTGYAQVQLPRISNHTVDYKSSELVLKQGETELQRVPVEMPKGEAEGSYEIILENVSFEMPELQDGQQLDLWLEVKLTDGQALTYNGCSWFLADGNLSLAVG